MGGKSGGGKSAVALGYVLLVTAGIVFGFVCFLGRNFLTLGKSRILNIVIATAVAAILIALAATATHMKHAYKNFGISLVKEIVSLFLFLVAAACFAYFDFSHCFFVLKQKPEIQNKLKESIDKTEEMFLEYEFYVEGVGKSYKKCLEDIAKKAKRGECAEDYGYDAAGDVSEDAYIENKAEALEKLLFSDAYKNMRKERYPVCEWCERMKDSVQIWNHITVVNIADSVKRKADGWRDSLTEFSKNPLIKVSRKEFVVGSSFDTAIAGVKRLFNDRGEPLSRLTAVIVFIGVLPIPAALAAVLLVAIMLLYYIFSRRYDGSGKFNILWLFGVRKPSRKVRAADDTSIRF